jgi:prolyl oligopeptidase
LLSFLRATRMHFAFVAVRGGGEKGEAWHQAGVKQHQADAVRDVLAASAFFRSQDSHQLHGKLPHGHVTRIVLHGVSHGACLSISALNKDPAAFAMVIGDLGIYDLVRYRNPHFKTDERTSAYIIQYGDPSTRDIFWIRSLSPLNTVNRTDKHHNKLPPIMLRAIAKDPIHHPVHSLKQLAELHWWHSANEHREPCTVVQALK